jgi:hypothetical protein
MTTIMTNSILMYLRAKLTAQNPVTKIARVRGTKQQQNSYKQNKKQGSLYSSSNNNDGKRGIVVPMLNCLRTTPRRRIGEWMYRLKKNQFFNSIQFLFICVPTQQPKGQLQS